MQQEIWIQESVPMIINGIQEFKNLMYKQIDIKPEIYLPVFAYLDNYARTIRPKEQNNSKALEEQKQVKTTVLCNNSDIITSLKKIENILYKQTIIHPEVYLQIIEKIREYIDILERQEKGEIIPFVVARQEGQLKEPDKEKSDNNQQENQENKTDKKSEEDLDLSNLKDFF